MMNYANKLRVKLTNLYTDKKISRKEFQKMTNFINKIYKTAYDNCLKEVIEEDKRTKNYNLGMIEIEEKFYQRGRQSGIKETTYDYLLKNSLIYLKRVNPINTKNMLLQLTINIKGKIKIIEEKSFDNKKGEKIEYKELTIELPKEKENATLRITPKSVNYNEIKEGQSIEGDFYAVPVYKNGANLILLKAINN